MQAIDSLLMASLASDRRSVEEEAVADGVLEAIFITSYIIFDQLDFDFRRKAGNPYI